jgi:putative multiple sugar transport system ATP-binding protein
MTLSSLWSQFSSHWVINRNDEIIAADDYRKKLDIRTPSIRQTTASLSGGNQQKVVLAKWILTRPDVLILDEPTRGIDVGAKYEIYEIINDLANAGKAVVFISSEMPELLGICDRIYVLNQGEIAGELNREEFSQEKIMKMIMSHIRREKQVI